MFRSLGLAVLCTLALLLTCTTAAGFLPADTGSLESPGADGEPVRVSVGFLLVDVLDIDGVRQTMRADFSVNLSWKDESLAGRWSGRHALGVGETWVPDIQIVNDINLARKRREVVEVDPDGTVTYRQRYFGDLSANMNLKDFPTDSHTFGIRFVSASPGEVEFVALEDRILQGKTLSVLDWVVGKGDLVMEQIDIGLATSPGFTFQFPASREGRYFLWKMIFPLAMIVFMSFAVFWIDPVQIEAQMGVASGAMLTVIAFLFSMSALSPKVPYQTRLDRYTFLSILVIFLALTEAVLSSRLAGHGRETAARRFDLTCRVLFPVVYLVMTLIIFLR
ncbi:MAG: hypothetical protein U9Q95_01270 [Candidatus Eisenbacteria bacterium]|nr:hypothetical protein [Candidatus Eisenbacteria bacterium]